jgi:hypothetical protein
VAKADRNLSTLLAGLKALDLPPETVQALNSHLSRISAAAAAGPSTDLTRILASIDPAIVRPVTELLAKHPKLFTSQLDVLAKTDEANQHPETSTTTDAVEDERPALERAVQRRLSKGDRPAHTVTWQRFCDNVRDDCGTEAWVTRSKERSAARGYGDKSIKRIVERLRDKQDK